MSNAQVILSFTTEDLQNVFKDLEKEHNIAFSYDEDLLNYIQSHFNYDCVNDQIYDLVYEYFAT